MPAGRSFSAAPQDEQKTRAYSYVINDFLTPNPAGSPDLDFSVITKIERPSETFVFAEASQKYDEADHFHLSDYAGQIVPSKKFAEQVAVERHAASANYVFVDGHVEAVSWSQVKERLNTPGHRFADPTAEAPVQ